MPGKVCIYCSPDQPTRVSFTKDHVVPKAFGKFKNNPVLQWTVCKECNQFFGDNLEGLLARGSLNSILRLNYGIRTAGAVTEIGKYKDRVRFCLSTKDEYDGLMLELLDYDTVENEFVVGRIPQVGFPRLDGSGYVYIAERDLDRPEKPLPPGIDASGPNTKLIYDSEGTKQRILRILARRSIREPKITEEGLRLKDEQIVIVVAKSTIDNVILRSIAKIAFNYLAWIAGTDFVARSDFNPIRSYIRYGIAPGYRIISVSQDAILANDGPTQRQTAGHLVTVGWSSDQRDIVGQVSLFNYVAYDITLSRNYSGLWRSDIRRGHHFNIDTREVEALAVIPRFLVGALI
jgi:hypothetical protein